MKNDKTWNFDSFEDNNSVCVEFVWVKWTPSFLPRAKIQTNGGYFSRGVKKLPSMRCGEFFMKFFGEKKLKPTLVETDFSYHYKVGGSMICYLYFCCLEEPFDIFLHLTNYRISKPNITITQIELQRHLKLFWGVCYNGSVTTDFL